MTASIVTDWSASGDEGRPVVDDDVDPAAVYPLVQAAARHPEAHLALEPGLHHHEAPRHRRPHRSSHELDHPSPPACLSASASRGTATLEGSTRLEPLKRPPERVVRRAHLAK